MDNIEYLFAGFAVFWAALFIYLLTLQARIRSLHKEIEQLEERLAESEGARRVASRDAAPGSTAASSRANS
ncbi:MAG: CcmD family protein [Dehalococcoidia bacterium]|nr:CcmD family protein [Dehalococcoidia bacterium]MCA9849027.1 CcmD family protein [Dehalococcoidia bacterium]MCA9856426.1 CcmD family protein [Dehalococcoidia bacterium]MCB9490994.1 CcmD family protein [Dehalococcoidia bacterium]